MVDAPSTAKAGHLPASSARHRLRSVRVEMTVAWADREQDVCVEAPDGAALSVVLPALVAAVDAPHDAPVWRGTDLLAPDTPLADRRLRSGVRLRFGTAGRVADGSPVLAVQVAGGPAAGRTLPLERGELSIGRSADNDLVLPDAEVSRRHAVLAVTASDITIRDNGSTNGTLLDGRTLPPDGARLRVGDVLRVGASLLAIAGPIGPPASVRPGPDGSVLLERAPRGRAPLVDRVITVPARAAPPRPRSVQWMTALLPAAAGVAIALMFGQPEFLLFALLSPAMVISSSLGDRLHWRRSRRRTAGALRRERAEMDRAVARGLRAETVVRRHAAPDPADLRRLVSLPDTRVWARRRGDPDLLEVRLGVTDVPSRLVLRDGASTTPAGPVLDVPLCVDLRRGPLGIAGPADTVQSSSRWLIAQLAAQTAPIDVEFALLLDAGREAQWRWARWLPHLRGKPAVTAAECVALVDTITSVVEERTAMRRSATEGWCGGWLVVIVDRPTPTGLAGLVDVLARGSDVGVTGLWLTATGTPLPACCASSARIVGVTGSRMTVHDAAGDESTAVTDQVSGEWADEVARCVAPLVDGGAVGEGGVPDACRLLDLLDLRRPGAAAVGNRWELSAGGARSVIGMGTSGLVSVDLASDGPHALIAGTTGAGKSELLRTIVAGLALAHAPDELNLLLIDYKGGAAFAECARLPHVAGLVTDLDPYRTQRALRSLRAELRRRERLFAAVGADDLHGYRSRRTTEPVPRLVIAVDEFATLADELPDFVSGLVNVARMGRSLGLHLVLATQRPGGVVSPEIRSNTDLRIALRVADPAESREVIGSPLAASIERGLPGRGYLRTGTALTCFQTAYASGIDARDVPAVRVELLDAWRRAPEPAVTSGDTDLARLAAAVTAAAHERGSAPARSPWPPPLPAALPRAELDLPTRPRTVVLGRVDLPDEQRQVALEFDLASPGSLLVAGAARSGRTSALTGLAIGAATACSPDELHLQVVDASGELSRALRMLPHCATVLGPAELGLVPTLFARLERAAAQRLAGGPGVSDSATVLLLIDGWDVACGAFSDAEAAAGTEALITLLRVAPTAGFAIAVAGDRAVLAPRFSGGFAERLLLRLPDRPDAGGFDLSPQERPQHLPPGRAVRATDGALVQLALAAESAHTLRADVAAIALRWMPAVPGPSAIRVRPLPDVVRLADLPTAPGRLTVGLAGDDPTPVLADPFAGAARWLVAGPPRSGRTTLLRLLTEQAHTSGIAMRVAATEHSALLVEARRRGIPAIGPTSGIQRAPAQPTLVLVDDSEAFTHTATGDQLAEWARQRELPLALVAAGRVDDLATSYRGVAAEVRRHRCGVLLRPGPLDGELLGVRRLPRYGSTGPPGRGVAVADPSWGAAFADGAAVPIQVATP